MQNLKKNEASELFFPMVDIANPNLFKTGESVTDTAYYKDGAGAWTTLAITDTITEIGATGMYELSLTAAELNHDYILMKVSSTNSQDSMLIIKTYERDIDDVAFPATPGNSINVNAGGEVDSNVQTVNDVPITGNGSTTPFNV